MASVTYRHKKYFAVAAESNFLTRQYVEPAIFAEEATETSVPTKNKLQDIVFLTVLPASLLGVGLAGFIHRFFS